MSCGNSWHCAFLLRHVRVFMEAGLNVFSVCCLWFGFEGIFSKRTFQKKRGRRSSSSGSDSQGENDVSKIVVTGFTKQDKVEKVGSHSLFFVSEEFV